MKTILFSFLALAFGLNCAAVGIVDMGFALATERPVSEPVRYIGFSGLDFHWLGSQVSRFQFAWPSSENENLLVASHKISETPDEIEKILLVPNSKDVESLDLTESLILWKIQSILSERPDLGHIGLRASARSEVVAYFDQLLAAANPPVTLRFVTARGSWDVKFPQASVAEKFLISNPTNSPPQRKGLAASIENCVRQLAGLPSRDPKTAAFIVEFTRN